MTRTTMMMVAVAIGGLAMPARAQTDQELMARYQAELARCEAVYKAALARVPQAAPNMQFRVRSAAENDNIRCKSAAQTAFERARLSRRR